MSKKITVHIHVCDLLVAIPKLLFSYMYISFVYNFRCFPIYQKLVTRVAHLRLQIQREVRKHETADDK